MSYVASVKRVGMDGGTLFVTTANVVLKLLDFITVDLSKIKGQRMLAF